MRGARSTLAVDGGELEIATVLSMAVGVLPQLIGTWHERYPKVAIRLHEYVHRPLLEEAVEQGVADFALGPMPVRKWDGPPRDGRLGGVRPRGATTPCPRRTETGCGSEELADLQWVLYHPDHGLAGIVEELCRNAGFTPRGTVRTSQAEGAVRLAAAGLGIALVPDNVVVRGIDCAVLAIEPRLYCATSPSTRACLSRPPRRRSSTSSARQGQPRPQGVRHDPPLDSAAAVRAPIDRRPRRCSSPAAAATRRRPRPRNPAGAVAGVREGARECPHRDRREARPGDDDRRRREPRSRHTTPAASRTTGRAPTSTSSARAASSRARSS